MPPPHFGEQPLAHLRQPLYGPGTDALLRGQTLQNCVQPLTKIRRCCHRRLVLHHRLSTPFNTARSLFNTLYFTIKDVAGQPGAPVAGSDHPFTGQARLGQSAPAPREQTIR